MKEVKIIPRIGWVRWLLPLVSVSALGTCSLVEPMRWQLPLRHMFSPLDIHRTGFGDFTMCMRVALSPEEAEQFVSKQFDPDDRIVRPVPMEQTMCPTAFWPKSFDTETTAYSVEQWPDGMIEGSSGAVNENGYLYFWANTM